MVTSLSGFSINWMLQSLGSHPCVWVIAPESWGQRPKTWFPFLEFPFRLDCGLYGNDMLLWSESSMTKKRDDLCHSETLSLERGRKWEETLSIWLRETKQKRAKYYQFFICLSGKCRSRYDPKQQIIPSHLYLTLEGKDTHSDISPGPRLLSIWCLLCSCRPEEDVRDNTNKALHVLVGFNSKCFTCSPCNLVKSVGKGTGRKLSLQKHTHTHNTVIPGSRTRTHIWFSNSQPCIFFSHRHAEVKQKLMKHDQGRVIIGSTVDPAILVVQSLRKTLPCIFLQTERFLLSGEPFWEGDRQWDCHVQAQNASTSPKFWNPAPLRISDFKGTWKVLIPRSLRVFQVRMLT